MKNNYFSQKNSKTIKRDGRIVDFDLSKITTAILKAGRATGEFGKETAEKLTLRVLELLQTTLKGKHPHVEEIQDAVEEVLLTSPYRKTAKAYIILYTESNMQEYEK